jgi:FAD/FMN-containing dehydrogenase/Fe-S oxidoreductase
MSSAVATAAKPNEVSLQLARELERHTQGEVMFDGASRGRYATDASIYQIMPVGVFVPKTADDVAVALDAARSLKVPVLPRGGGTSQCGQTVGAALVVDCAKHLRKVVSVDVQARVAVVEPGLVLDHLNAELKPHGLWYPVDVSTSAQATLGGMAGNNSCGSRSIAYGNMVHNVLGAQAWLSDGSLVDFGRYDKASGRALAIGDGVRDLAALHQREMHEHWPRVMRRVAGYNLDIFDNRSERPYTRDGHVNLAHLLVGSEGTLAFTKNLTLQLTDLPRSKVLGVVNFKKFRQAMASAQHIVKLQPTAVELVDRIMIELALTNPAFAPTMREALLAGHDTPEAILLVEFSDAGAAKLDELQTLMADLGHPGSVVRMVAEPAQKALWEVRKAGLNIMMSLKGDGKPVSFIEDCAVPLEHLADYTDALTEVFERHGTHGTWYAHASVGTLHVRPILDMRRDGAAKMRLIAQEASQLVRKYKGAYSGEHGDGLCRGEWIRWQFGPRIDEAFRVIKHSLDPLNLFNPGKIIDPPRMDDTALMRYPPSYKRIPIATVLDWSAWNVQNDPVTETTTAPGTGGDVTGGLASAAEMCNNNGHCRKFDAGTMCPSYRVTRDEKHLTRGRANTLRLALSGQLEGQGTSAQDALTSQAVREVMDLCVSCKGCKRDCPTGVDMARMKVEFLAQDRLKNGHSLKDHMVSKLPDYAPWLSALPWLANLRDQWPLAARLSQRWVGLSAQRRLPQWRRDTFWRGVKRGALSSALVNRQEALARAQRGERVVALFVDTFNGYFESENAHAAVHVFEAAGYAVHVVSKGDAAGTAGGALCCGRTHLATGMVDEAKAKLHAMLDAMLPLAQQGVGIVGLEPSCLLTLRDEALVLKLGDKAHTVAKHAFLFEEFVAGEVKAGRFKLKLKPSDKPILVHGHCHQKAFGAVSPIMDVLALIPQSNGKLIESSCCGMAGSFGYEAAHHEISMQMAELSLLPALRKSPDAVVVADGTSCRHQIADGLGGRQALHAATLLARHLISGAR